MDYIYFTYISNSGLWQYLCFAEIENEIGIDAKIVAKKPRGIEPWFKVKEISFKEYIGEDFCSNCDRKRVSNMKDNATLITKEQYEKILFEPTDPQMDLI